jgi:NAD(P)-dependent dehydrogenase (short-subunit alcohol dehydrogenase family)
MPDSRAILVTGGANGLGAAMVRRFTADGHRVAVADLDSAAGEALAQATGSLFVRTDVTVLADNQAAVRQAAGAFGGLDAVCLNAGVPGGTTTGADFDPDRYRRAMQVNLDGFVYGANAAMPYLRERGGAILITSSLAGLMPFSDLYYATAKHALIGLTRSLAQLLEPDHVTVNALCPGFADTRLIAPVRDVLAAAGYALADPDDVAAVAAMILDSPATGQAWAVQAGQPAYPVSFPEVTLAGASPAEPVS